MGMIEPSWFSLHFFFVCLLKNDKIGGMKKTTLKPIIQAFLAALLFGASAPISKIFLGDVEPIPLAGFLYLGSGVGLFFVQLFQIRDQLKQTEAPVRREDVGWLIGAIFAGGVAAPIILLFGLRDTAGATASLLLNFEGVATTLIAAIVFKEAVSKRAWWAISVITGASILLSLNPGDEWGISWGALGVLLACVFWGMDNNFTLNISAKNPVTIVMVKGLTAGSFSLLLALLLRQDFPNVDMILKAMLLGSLSYGLSITLFIRAMRGLGSARTSALFGTAPLAGIALSLLVLNESVGWLFWTSLPLMMAGAILLVYEDHEHQHTHEEALHEHMHSHDDGHHGHSHEAQSGNHNTHSHKHIHVKTEHSHHHMPDIHHRHTHEAGEEVH